MKYEIIGIEPVNYVSKKTGRPVKGTNLHCYDLNKADGIVYGQAVDRLYVKESIDCRSLQPGDHINIFYNRWGNIDEVRLCEP